MADTRFQALGGTSRRYLDLFTGEEISRREYYVRSGRPSFEAIKEIRMGQAGYRNPMAQYNAITRDYRETVARRMNIKATDVRVRGVSETAQKFRQIMAALKSKDDSPTGIKANALIELGRREAEWTFAVSESPGAGR